MYPVFAQVMGGLYVVTHKKASKYADFLMSFAYCIRHTLRGSLK